MMLDYLHRLRRRWFGFSKREKAWLNAIALNITHYVPPDNPVEIAALYGWKKL